MLELPTSRTPIAQIDLCDLVGVRVQAKLEFRNPSGSVKDRAAHHAIMRLLQRQPATEQTCIVESSSGNMGIALATVCRELGLNFHCVVDPLVTQANEQYMRELGATLHKVSERDVAGGFLLTRIARVKQLLAELDDARWVNQYANEDVALAYERTLGAELCEDIPKPDYIFLAVSSGGTIAGVSRAVKARFPRARVVAVDVEGSVIFGQSPSPRHIPGVGSGMRSPLVNAALIDEAVIVSEVEAIHCCHELWVRHNVHAGGSAGAVIAGIRSYFSSHPPKRHRSWRHPSEPPILVATVFADSGERYLDSIYDEAWCRRHASLPTPLFERQPDHGVLQSVVS